MDEKLADIFAITAHVRIGMERVALNNAATTFENEDDCPTEKEMLEEAKDLLLMGLEDMGVTLNEALELVTNHTEEMVEDSDFENLEEDDWEHLNNQSFLEMMSDEW